MRVAFVEEELCRGQVLGEAGESMRHIYFPTTCLISAVAIFKSGDIAELSTTGNEGMIPFGAILGTNRTIARHMVEIPGRSLVVRYDDFVPFARDSPAFSRLLRAFALAFATQLMQSAACNSMHSLEQRAARWLLMSDDRSAKDLQLTQQFLAEMLGASRPRTSAVVRRFRQARLISYSRGIIRMENRAGLEEISCECYDVIRQAYDQHLGSPLQQ